MDNLTDNLIKNINQHKKAYSLGILAIVIVALITLVVWVNSGIKPVPDEQREVEANAYQVQPLSVAGLYALREAGFSENNIMTLQKWLVEYFTEYFPDYRKLSYTKDSLKTADGITTIELDTDTGAHYSVQLSQKLQNFFLYHADGTLASRGNLDCNQVTSYPDDPLGHCIPHQSQYLKLVANDLSLERPKLTAYLLIPYRDAPNDEAKNALELQVKQELREWIEAKGGDIEHYDITYVSERY